MTGVTARSSPCALVLAASLPMWLLAGCDAVSRGGGDDPRARGRDVVRLTAPDRARLYAAALGQAFDLGPGLTLLLDPALLPAGGGYDRARSMPPPVTEQLRASGIIRGTCVPERRQRGAAPSCAADMAGYAVRLSEIFRAAGDTVRLYLRAERFSRAADGARYAPAFAFEERYSLVRSTQGWSVVKKERKRAT